MGRRSLPFIILVLALVALALVVYDDEGEQWDAVVAVGPSEVSASPTERLRAPAKTEREERPILPELKLEPPPEIEYTETLSAIAQLAELISRPIFNRAKWKAAAHALCASLPPTAAQTLQSFLAKTDTPIAECIAAAELLHLADLGQQLSDESILPALALTRLRDTLQDTSDDAVRLTTTRALVGAGELQDAIKVVDDLLWSGLEEAQADAVWSLGANHRPSVAEYLTGKLFMIEDDLRMSRALGSLTFMQLDADFPMLDEYGQKALEQVVQEILSREWNSCVMIAMMCFNALAADSDSTVLLDAVAATDNLGQLDSMTSAFAIMVDPKPLANFWIRFYNEPDPARRSVIIQGLLNSGTKEPFPAEIRSEAIELFSDYALHGTERGERERAVKVLALNHDERALDTLIRVLREDSDEEVRMAAIRAISRFPNPLLQRRRAELEEFDDTVVKIQNALQVLRAQWRQ